MDAITPDNVKAVVEKVFASPYTSQWLKSALLASLGRDPVDAVNDVEVLYAILNAHEKRVRVNIAKQFGGL